ncbi:hypothetical protein B0T10DRAFT_96475 [Thelonectria olida]|uniref:Uncharacterized protein n=1 Tax=Thelonectria olida TaxID=1576542 RepID=A0A9P9APK4_9HYPO|nr:hypothetical protein B0T10DRAFT_96475 [Thelonectria olida]
MCRALLILALLSFPVGLPLLILRASQVRRSASIRSVFAKPAARLRRGLVALPCPPRLGDAEESRPRRQRRYSRIARRSCLSEEIAAREIANQALAVESWPPHSTAETVGCSACSRGCEGELALESATCKHDNLTPSCN